MLPHIINQFALKSETIVETKFHTVQTYQGPDICWDAIKIPVFGASQHTFGAREFVKALLDTQFRFWQNTYLAFPKFL